MGKREYAKLNSNSTPITKEPPGLKGSDVCASVIAQSYITGYELFNQVLTGGRASQ